MAEGGIDSLRSGRSPRPALALRFVPIPSSGRFAPGPLRGPPPFSRTENGGEGGIRTPGRLPYARFPSGYFKPLSHLSSDPREGE
jgi:hypothetical protein